MVNSQVLCNIQMRVRYYIGKCSWMVKLSYSSINVSNKVEAVAYRCSLCLCRWLVERGGHYPTTTPATTATRLGPVRLEYLHTPPRDLFVTVKSRPRCSPLQNPTEELIQYFLNERFPQRLCSLLKWKCYIKLLGFVEIERNKLVFGYISRRFCRLWAEQLWNTNQKQLTLTVCKNRG